MKSIDMIEQMNTAWRRKNELGNATFAEYSINLLTHAFVEIENMVIDSCKNRGVAYDDSVFIAVQRILIFFIKCDDDFFQQEYDAYKDFCSYCNFKPLSPDEITDLYNEWGTDVFVQAAKNFVGFRPYIDEDKYESFVLGLCYFSLLGDKAMDEYEYYLLKCFYDPSYGDYAPRDWDAFKREWN